ncbi:hypothetical protein DI383_14250 [Flavobacteriaceae bacterium LYZ1037]|nr:hypothetical protein DI383_14250 [Flavobacteriaceae bacterium LYZ1037]
MKNKATIFFSYANKDNKYLKLLKIFIKSIDKDNQIEYFDYTERNENTAESNYGELYENIEKCDFFIAILTNNYLNSPLCCWEAGLAYKENRNRKSFNMVAMKMTQTINILELERTFSKQLNFNKLGLINLVNFINESERKINFTKLRIDENLENLQKQTESILLKNVISNNSYSESELDKLKKLME